MARRAHLPSTQPANVRHSLPNHFWSYDNQHMPLDQLLRNTHQDFKLGDNDAVRGTSENPFWRQMETDDSNIKVLT